MLILDLWGISFHAVVVFALGKNLLFKSALGHCEYLILSGLKTFVVTSSTASLTPRYQQGACQRAASACVTSFFEVALHALKHHQEKEVREAVFNLVRLLIINTSASTLQSSPDTC